MLVRCELDAVGCCAWKNDEPDFLCVYALVYFSHTCLCALWWGIFEVVAFSELFPHASLFEKQDIRLLALLWFRAFSENRLRNSTSFEAI